MPRQQLLKNHLYNLGNFHQCLESQQRTALPYCRHRYWV
ncbi:unnamed protein product [Rodentolepis nana]|uniref:Uncharacterized protein n=1 Tax=Rodentolepis nana TaxID=102285 RepID=A0A0R3TF57_RODNA|nr:unnamed protein product [Rodentolepis nana]